MADPRFGRLPDVGVDPGRSGPPCVRFPGSFDKSAEPLLPVILLAHHNAFQRKPVRAINDLQIKGTACPGERNGSK